MKMRVLLGLLALLIVASFFNDRDDDDESASATSGSTAGRGYADATRTSTTAQPNRTAEQAAAAGEVVTVTHVIDGDTFELADGRTVRVLGIDSCEMDTWGGTEAQRSADNNLTNPYNQPITLTAEPGVDADRYGRLLRYVTMDGEYDFGEDMVKNDHTGVYQGENDASPAYLDRLYAADLQYARNPPAGRDCTDPYAEDRDDVDVDVDVDYSNLPDGALTGGYCSSKWWC